jgi:hypothetical protein
VGWNLNSGVQVWKQVLCHLGHTSNPLYPGCFGDGGSQKLFAWGWPWTKILPISASQVARITGMNQQCPGRCCILLFYFFNLSPSIWNNSFTFSWLLLPWHFRWLQVSYFVECPSIWDCSFVVRYIQVKHLGMNITKVVLTASCQVVHNFISLLVWFLLWLVEVLSVATRLLQYKVSI